MAVFCPSPWGVSGNWWDEALAVVLAIQRGAQSKTECQQKSSVTPNGTTLSPRGTGGGGGGGRRGAVGPPVQQQQEAAPHRAGQGDMRL